MNSRFFAPKDRLSLDMFFSQSISFLEAYWVEQSLSGVAINEQEYILQHLTLFENMIDKLQYVLFPNHALFSSELSNLKNLFQEHTIFDNGFLGEAIIGYQKILPLIQNQSISLSLIADLSLVPKFSMKDFEPNSDVLEGVEATNPIIDESARSNTQEILTYINELHASASQLYLEAMQIQEHIKRKYR